MSRARTDQLIEIVALLGANGFDQDVITAKPWRLLCLAECWLYEPVSDWLDSLTVESASALIDKLQLEVS